MAMKDVALRFASKGFPVFPLNSKNKRPILKKPPDGKGGFHQATTDVSQIEAWWMAYPGALVGLRTGRESRTFVLDIDRRPNVDGAKAFEELEAEFGLLPETLTVDTASNGLHLYFKWDERLAEASIDAGGLGPGVDWRGEGGYVVAPGSASMALGEWLLTKTLPFAELPEAWIKKILSVRKNKGDLAKQIMNGENITIPKGQRNNVLTSVAGHLRRQEFKATEIELKLRNINVSYCNPPLLYSDVEKIAQSIGSKPIPNSVSPDLVDRYAYVVQIERFVDLQDPEDKFSKSQINDMHRSKGLAQKLILESQIKIVKRLTFLPGADRIVDDSLNLWRPSDISSKPGDVSPFLQHVEYLIPDEESRDHVLDFMAHVIQKPQDRILHALLICGKEGIGKSYLAVVMSLVLGRHNVRMIGMNELQSSFNAWAEGVQLVRVEEIMMMGRRDLMNRLKPLITEDEILVNQKGIPTYTIPNHVHLMLFSNHQDALKINSDDRRYCIVHCEAEKRERPYYEELFRWTRGNVPALAHYLELRNLSRFNPKWEPPATKAKLEMIESSMGVLEQFIRTRIEDQEHPFECDMVSTAALVESLVGQYSFGRRYLNITNIGRILGKIGIKRKIRLNGKRSWLYAVRDLARWSEASEKEWAEAYERP